jgi:hypothetical protein
MLIERECSSNTDLHRYPALVFIVDLLLDDLKKNSPIFFDVANILYDDLDSDQFHSHMEKLLKIYGFNEFYLIRLCDYYRLEEIYSNERSRDNLRGALLERFTCKLIEKNYEKDEKQHIRCFIVFPTLSLRSKKEVDVFFYITDDEIGESIECKIKPFWLVNADIMNLKDIFTKSEEKIYPSIVSFSSKRELELRIKDLGEQLGPIKLYGYDNLIEICRKT